MAPILIRIATEKDMDAVQQIYADEVLNGSASFELDPPDRAEIERRWRTVLEAGLPYFVAEHAHKVAGYAYAAPYRPRPAYRYTVENSVYVDRSSRGQGIGLALLEQLIEACRASGARQMIGIIGDSENHASIGLHERAGFRKIGVLADVGWKFGRWLDSVVMQRALESDTRPPQGEGR